MRKIFRLYKTAFSGLPKNIWLLSAVMLINRSGTMVVAFLALYCTEYLHQTPSFAGIAITCYGIGAIVGALIGGKLSDKIGYSKVQTTALIGGGILFIAASFATNFSTFCFLLFLLAAVNESFRPANTSAIVANTTIENRTRAFALLRLAMNLGWSIGTTIGGLLCAINYNLIFWVDGFTSIAAGISMFCFKFKPLVKTIVNEDEKEISPYKNKPFLIFIIGTLLFTFCFFQLFTNLSLFYKKGLHLNEKLIGIILALNGIVIVLFEMLIVKQIEHLHSKRKIIVIGTIGMSLFFWMSSLGTNIHPLLNAYGGMLLITFSEILALPFMNSYYLSYAGKTNTGKYAAVYTISWSIGQILAGFIGGIVIDIYGFSWLWIGAALLSLLAATIYYKVIKH
jgi:predicted MFS family arabinose efflux permease